MENDNEVYVISGVPGRPDLEGMELTWDELDEFTRDPEIEDLLAGNVVLKSDLPSVHAASKWNAAVAEMEEQSEKTKEFVEKVEESKKSGNDWIASNFRVESKGYPTWNLKNANDMRRLVENYDVDALIKNGALKYRDPVTGKYRTATSDDVDRVNFTFSEIPSKDLTRSEYVPSEKFEFPTFQDMSTGLASAARKNTFLRESLQQKMNPYYGTVDSLRREGNPDTTKAIEAYENYEKSLPSIDERIDRDIQGYIEHQQWPATKWVAENMDAFDIATAPIGAASLPTKTLAKMGPLTRLGVETAMQGGLEAAHTGIEGGDAGDIAIASGLGAGSAAVPGLIASTGGNVSKYLRGKKMLQLGEKLPDNKETFGAAIPLMDDASIGLREKIAQGITYPTIHDRPLLSPTDVEADIVKRTPTSEIVRATAPGQPSVNWVRMGNELGGYEEPYTRAVWYPYELPSTKVVAYTEDGRPVIGTVYNTFDVEKNITPEADNVGSWIHGLRGFINDTYRDLSLDGVPSKDLKTLIPGENEVASDLERRIVEQFPNTAYISFKDLVLGLNRFEPKNEYELAIKNKLLDNMTVADTKAKWHLPWTSPAKYELVPVEKPVPHVPEGWQNIDKNDVVGSGWWNFGYSKYPHIGFSPWTRDLAREGMSDYGYENFEWGKKDKDEKEGGKK